MIFLAAPQGAGKTTFSEVFQEVCSELGFRAATLSIDDFYLPLSQQKRRKSNELLSGRGMPGTHDVHLAAEILQKLRGRGGAVALMKFDKAADGNSGARVEGGSVTLPLDFVIFDGWCIGFEPLDNKDASALSRDMQEVNENLREMKVVQDNADAWVVLGVENYEIAYTWREEQEIWRETRGIKRTMSSEECIRFVSRFIPGYEAYQPTLQKNAATGKLFGKPTLYLQLDENRKAAEN